MFENSPVIKYNITNIERIIKLKSLLDNLTLTEKIFYSYFNGDIKFIYLGDIIVCECNENHIFTLEINNSSGQYILATSNGSEVLLHNKNKLYLDVNICNDIYNVGWFDNKLKLMTHIEQIINKDFNFNCIVIIYNNKLYY